MRRIKSFPPVLGKKPWVLVLGSMPGLVSLEKQEYYALPRNSFWRIMGDLFDAGFDVPYQERLSRLTDSGVALWDVFESCIRDGSLDSAILDKLAVPNGIGPLLKSHPTIHTVFFNGQKAAKFYNQHVKPGLCRYIQNIAYYTLPSTSPAYAAMPYEQKRKMWSIVKRRAVKYPDWEEALLEIDMKYLEKLANTSYSIGYTVKGEK